jgi:hypothetical protein
MTDSDDTTGEGGESAEPAVRILHLDPDETIPS